MSLLSQIKNSGKLEASMKAAGYAFNPEGIDALIKDAAAGKESEQHLKTAAAELEASNSKVIELTAEVAKLKGAAEAAQASAVKAETDAKAAIDKATAELDAKASIKGQEMLAGLGHKTPVKNDPKASAEVLKPSAGLTGIARAIAAHRAENKR